jgi:hypothetical protein
VQLVLPEQLEQLEQLVPPEQLEQREIAERTGYPGVMEKMVLPD